MAMLNMGPSFPSNCRKSRGSADTEQLSNRREADSALRISYPHSYDRALRELRQSVFLPSERWSVSPSLAHHIVHVLLLGSDFQMKWIAARPVSNTAMQHEKTIWHGASVMHHPSDLMGTERSPSRPGPEAELTIAATGQETGHPRPAFLWRFTIYFGPKPFLSFWRQQLREHRRRDNLCSHKSVHLICATLSARQGARALSL